MLGWGRRTVAFQALSSWYSPISRKMQPLGGIGRLLHVFYRARRPHFKIIGIHPAAGLLRYYFPLFPSRLRQQIWCFCTQSEKNTNHSLSTWELFYSPISSASTAAKNASISGGLSPFLSPWLELQHARSRHRHHRCPSAPRERACIGRGEGTDWQQPGVRIREISILRRHVNIWR